MLADGVFWFWFRVRYMIDKQDTEVYYSWGYIQQMPILWRRA